MCSWIRILNIIHISIHHILIFRYNKILISILVGSGFVPPRNQQANSKIHVEMQKTQNNQITLGVKTKQQSWDLKLLSFNT